MSLIGELKRRNVLRVSAAYVVTAWLILQVTEVVVSLTPAPGWVGTTVLLILLAGFPICLLLSWFFELTPEGLRRDSEADRAGRGNGRRIDFVIIGILAAALLVLVLQNHVLEEPAGVPAPRPLPSTTIAVLPFSNMSAANENADFFATGMHDDLLTQLAKLSGLRVISRTSVLEYAETTKNMRQIGAELGAGTLLEGSVMRAGDTIRINAQLIDANTDEHLWAETFDRELTTGNVFAIQSEIAGSIATTLHLAVSTRQQRLIDYVPTASLEAYERYLRARAAQGLAVTTWESFATALELYQKVFEVDPDFALAHADHAFLQAKAHWWGYDPDGALIEGAKRSLERAREINPDLPEVWLSLGYYRYWSARDYTGALEAFIKAGEYLPGDGDVSLAKAYLQRRLGQWQQSISSMNEAMSQNPRDGELYRQQAQTYGLIRDYQRSIDYYDRGLALTDKLISLHLERAFIDMYRSGDTTRLRELARNPPIPMQGTRAYAGWRAAGIDGRTDDAMAYLDELSGELIQDQDSHWPVAFARGHTYLVHGDPDRAKPQFAQAIAWLEDRRASTPGDTRIYAALGTIYAARGDLAAAREAYDTIGRQVPYEKDHFLGGNFQFHATMIPAAAGDLEWVLEALEKYLSNAGYWSAEALSKLPRFAAFREEPEFKAMIERYGDDRSRWLEMDR